jgi:acetoin utilization deacetylase AcuC-like enzyme
VSTAFVSHPDCARHDTGWGHPDHQGRIPALVRAVHRDMLTLHGALLQEEGWHAAPAHLLRAHAPEHLQWLHAASARAAAEGSPFEAAPGTVVSGASEEAALAAAGCALAGAEAVLAGRARNGFCLTRPPGAAAGRREAAHGCLLNNLAVAALHLLEEGGAGRVACLELGPRALTGTPAIVRGRVDVALEGVRTGGGGGPAGLEGPLAAALERLEGAAASGPPFTFLLVGLDLDPYAGAPGELHADTRALLAWAESHAAGRPLTLLEGGSDAVGGGRALVQHLRALAELPPA